MRRLKNLSVAFGVFAALLLQSAVFPVLCPRWAVPDLVFCFSAVVSIIAGTGPGVAVALLEVSARMPLPGRSWCKRRR